MERTRFSTWLLILGAAFCSMAFDTDDDDFVFYLSTDRTFVPGNPVNVYLNGRFSKSVAMEFELYRVNDPVDFFNEQENPHSPGTAYDAEEEKQVSTINLKDRRRYKSVADWRKRIKNNRRYWMNENISVPVQDAGVYLLVARAEKQKKMATTIVVVTNAGVVVKQSDDRILGYAVSLADGRRATDARIVFRKRDGIIERRTDRNGVATLPTAELDDAIDPERETDGRQHWRYYGRETVLYGESDGHFFISDSYFYRHYQEGAESYRTYIHTDRPVYRPNQKVFYRTILRGVNSDGTYRLPEKRNAAIVVTDSRGDELLTDTAELDDFGTLRGEFTLGDEPPLGDYNISVTVDGSHAGGGNFAVEEYKKPEYEVTVATTEESYSGGKKVTGTIQADYYFGSPVAEATVEYRIMRSRYWVPWWSGSRWAYLYRSMPLYQRNQQYVDRGSGKLKADGSFEFSFETPKELEQDYTYSVRAFVTDASRRTIGGSTTVLVTRGAFYLTSRTERYVYEPGNRIDLIVGANRFGANNRGVATSFGVEVTRRWWSRRGRGGGGTEVVTSFSGRTDKEGDARASFDVEESGYYTATVTAKDENGNEITNATSIYVAEPGYRWGDLSADGAQIIPDRELYAPGDVITALVVMPHGDIDALITTEGPTIFSHTVERLGGNSAIIRIPVEARYAPSIDLTVSGLVGDRFYQTGKQIIVAPDEQMLTIDIDTDKKEYRPGDAGTVTLRVLDAKGRPVPNVDLAVGVVDEAIYAIRPEIAEPINDVFYGMRWNTVNTTSSLSFRFWTESVEEKSFAAEDEMDTDGSAISLRSANAPVMAQEMNRNEQALPPGSETGTLVEPALRQDFRDLMHWSGSIRTDSRGYATIPVNFPDNLTTWRITARGITQATQVGQATAEVIARKDLLVRMETPRFITEGDELLIATNVHNYLDTEKDVTVEFDAKGVEQKKTRKTVTIPANGETRVDWEIEAPEIGEATFTVRALTDEESDAMQMKVPIMPRGVLTGTSAIASIDNDGGTERMVLELPQQGRLETANLVVALSPSAASSMMGALDDLIGYPYGCVEQTMSRFLPTVVVADVLEELEIPFDQAKRAELPKMVEQGLKRLRTLQHDDGGWGWWEHDDTNPFMTAYVLYGLTTARAAGYPVDDGQYQRGRDKLYGMIEERTAGGSLGGSDARLSTTTEAYMLYVASILDDRGDADGMVENRIDDLHDEKDLNPYAIALLALAADAQGQNKIANRLADRLVSSVAETETGAYWSGSTWHYNWQDDKVETSAAAVKALLAIRGDTPLVQKSVRWLLGQKQGSSWHNTRQTAMVIYSLVDYLKVSNELNPDYELVVAVNGKEVARQQVTRDDVFSEEITVRVGPEGLRTGRNIVTVSKSGAGRLYGAARLNYYAVGHAIRAGNAGFKVERDYYRLERVKRKDAYVYEKKKIDAGDIKSGDELFVRLRVTPERQSEYVMVEDPLPAGCEVVRETNGYTIVGEDAYGGGNRGYYGWSWNYWYADRDIRDEKITFFATSMPSDTQEMTYILRAQIPGTYGVMPAVAALMYYPEVRGNSDAIELAIGE